MANAWGEQEWGEGDWGQQDITTVPLNGLLTTLSTTLNSAGLLSYPEEGWGRFGWSEMGWGDDSNTVYLSGLGFSVDLNAAGISAASENGWGRAAWGEEPWGDSYSPVIPVTGFDLTTTLGTLAYAQAEDGWGRDEWGTGNWGQNTTTVLVDGMDMNTSLGPDGWGVCSWGEAYWGGPFAFTNIESNIGISGLQITSDIGTPTYEFDMIFDISTSLNFLTGIGTLNINNGADHSQGLASFNVTTTLNSGGLAHEMIYGISGLAITSSLNTDLVVDNAELVIISTLNAMSMATPSGLTVADMVVGLSGLNATFSIGSVSIADMSIGLTGLEFNVNLGSSGVSPLGYKDIDITGYTAYTDVTHAA